MRFFTRLLMTLIFIALVFIIPSSRNVAMWLWDGARTGEFTADVPDVDAPKVTLPGGVPVPDGDTGDGDSSGGSSDGDSSGGSSDGDTGDGDSSGGSSDGNTGDGDSSGGSSDGDTSDGDSSGGSSDGDNEAFTGAPVSVGADDRGYSLAANPSVPFPLPTDADYAEAWDRLSVALVAPEKNEPRYNRDNWMPDGADCRDIPSREACEKPAGRWAPVEGVPALEPPLGKRCDARDQLFKIWAVSNYEPRDDCYPLAGTYNDGYIGETYSVPEVEAADIDGEHIIALSEAHQSGGWQWGLVERSAFATDYQVRSYHDGGTQLYLSDGDHNQHVKNDKDPFEYLPAYEGSRCGFVVNWIAVKDRYGLGYNAEELNSITDQLTVCQDGGVPDLP